ncbi:MAG: ATP-binding cassette domain-containing protein [Candidatus Aminicenantes bacterium]|nr:ATP-binding cassette domain-containing protein [Candidatus Aminicenantes bacterium]
MCEKVLKINNLGKKYFIGERVSYTALRDVLVSKLKAPFKKAASREKNFIWALRDVTFDVNDGDILGIIGRNGAGKSTLLKILSRITRPTTGSAEIRGRVGSLLEVGTGFHPELTGRENIYLNGAILGMHRTEINRKFDEIVAFSEIEKFIDTPVKFYSSGMYVRLAFSVAAHLEPEILLVDEVLAVGDAGFQKKCLGRMSEVSREGRTILFVSHNMHAVRKLCSRAIFLENGGIEAAGEPGTVINNYLSRVKDAQLSQVWEDMAAAPGNDAIRMHKVQIQLTEDEAEQLTVWTSFKIEFYFWNLEPGLKLNLSMRLYNFENILLFNSTSVFESHWHGKPFKKGLYKSTCYVPGKLLNDGMYYIDLLFIKDTTTRVCHFDNLLTFEIGEEEASRPGKWYGKYVGVVRPFLQWETEYIADPAHETKNV